MSSRDLTFSMKLYADASRFVAGFTQGEVGVKKLTSTAKREFDALKSTLGSVEGKLATLGVTIGTTAAIMQSARMDKSLTQIGQTAGASESEVFKLRKELFRMSKETGQNLDDLQQGFNNAVQAGLMFGEALPVIDATNKAVAVTGAQADVLTGALTVAATAFNFDLSKPGQALILLDKMTVAGRLGNAELENLSGIFSRIGPNAAAAGFTFDQTLAFVEGLSMIERQPERLSTLADSTLRLFTNLRYMRDAQKATGVQFFADDGSRRDGAEVIAEIKQQYDKLNTEKERALFIQKAFGKADMDTIKGMRISLAGDMLSTINRFDSTIGKAPGTIIKDVPNAINNAVDQVGRLKSALREAGDDFSKPIKDTIEEIIKLSLNTKEQGGFGMDGKDILLAAGGGILGTALAARYGGMAISGIAGKFGSMTAGVTTGMALEQAAGVTPVYVVNMPASGLTSGIMPTAAGVGAGTTAAAIASKFKVSAALLGGSNMAALRMMGVGAMGTAGLGVAGAGLAGYGTGKLINKGIEGTFIADAIGRQVAIALAPFSAEARSALKSEFEQKAAELKGLLTIKLDQDGRYIGSTVKTNQPGMNVNVSNGLYMHSPQ